MYELLNKGSLVTVFVFSLLPILSSDHGLLLGQPRSNGPRQFCSQTVGSKKVGSLFWKDQNWLGSWSVNSENLRI